MQTGLPDILNAQRLDAQLARHDRCELYKRYHQDVPEQLAEAM